MTDTTLFPPGSKLRRRAQVIEHEAPRKPVQPLIEAFAPERNRATDSKPWEFDDHGLIIIPGLLTWDSFEEMWAVASGIQQSSLFYIGDALNAGEAKFGEQVWQIDCTGYQPETLRSAQWVSRTFPIARRRRLPYSYHRACASSKLTPSEQDDILDLVELKKARHEPFGTREIAALVAERIAEKQRATNIEPDPVLEPDPETFLAEEEAAELVEDELRDMPLAAEPVPEPETSEAHRLIEEIRAVADLVAVGQHSPILLRDLSNRVIAAAGRRLVGWSSNVLQNADAAESLVPDGWRLAITGSYRKSGKRHWEVRVHHLDGARFILTDGPGLACCLSEAALTAVASDAGQP